MGRGEQKKNHDDCTKDNGESNRRSTRLSAGEGGSGSSSSHTPAARKDPNSHAPNRSRGNNSKGPA